MARSYSTGSRGGNKVRASIAEPDVKSPEFKVENPAFTPPTDKKELFDAARDAWFPTSHNGLEGMNAEQRATYLAYEAENITEGTYRTPDVMMLEDFADKGKINTQMVISEDGGKGRTLVLGPGEFETLFEDSRFNGTMSKQGIELDQFGEFERDEDGDTIDYEPKATSAEFDRMLKYLGF
jgi:hypothetical protein